MEILSTGEKIKRSRIYKGYTLKDLCGEKISVSKMSCIENGKVKPEDWILQFVSEKLNINLDYLKTDVKDQLESNIVQLEKSIHNEEYEKKLLYYIRYSEQCCYYDLSFKLYHLLFNYYLKGEDKNKVQNLILEYYNCCQKVYELENRQIYYMDIASYFYCSNEYLQAGSYYNNIRKLAKENSNFINLAKATYNETACYMMLKNYEAAYSSSEGLEELIQYIEGNIGKAEAYHMLAMLSIRKDKSKFKFYEEKSYLLYGGNYEYKAHAMFNYASIMFGVNINDEAVKYISEALECYPKENMESYVDFLLLSINELLENGVLDKAQSICDEALNHSISLDNIKFIEKAYYYKGIILQKSDSLFMSEMYMNLALDALAKFGTKADIHKRYLEMGSLYHKLGNISEALKYFTLAVSLEKKL